MCAPQPSNPHPHPPGWDGVGELLDASQHECTLWRGEDVRIRKRRVGRLQRLLHRKENCLRQIHLGYCVHVTVTIDTSMLLHSIRSCAPVILGIVEYGVFRMNYT